ncbi:hypothetical protein TRVL_09736 [Trypanosoma vivax]|nr:hypothetical protein TRVL_09736 [Trypanosoma vivax]
MAEQLSVPGTSERCGCVSGLSGSGSGSVESAKRSPGSEGSTGQPTARRRIEDEVPCSSTSSIVGSMQSYEYRYLGKEKLHDFLNEHFGKTFNAKNVSMEGFINFPADTISDEAILGVVIALPLFAKYRDSEDIKRAVRDLNGRGVVTIGLWKGHEAEKKNNMCAIARGVLNAALPVAEQWWGWNAKDDRGGCVRRLRVCAECEVEPRAVWPSRQLTWHARG